MKPSDVSRALSCIIPTRQSALILGAPGLGKSSIAFQAGAPVFGEGADLTSTVKGLPDVPWLQVLRALDLDPTDMKGLPFFENGRTKWGRVDLLDKLRPEGGILLIEELPQAIPAVQCVLRELLLDRRIGGHKIPSTWSVLATGNRATDRAGAAKLLTHVASSVVVMDLEASVEDWQSWALKSGIAPDVRSFINFKPSALHSFDPARLVNTDPRGWERVSILSAALPDDLMLPVLSGVVESGHAAEFISFRQMYHKLPDPKSILASPDTSSVPSEPAVLYALSGALAEAVRGKNGTDKNLTALVRYAARLPKVFATLLMLDAVSLHRQIVALPAAAGWLRENRALLLGK